jgi:hypothetical protein
MLRWIVAVVALAGCAGPCAEVAAERKALAARTASPTAAPHAAVRVPFALANQLIAGVLDAPPKVPIHLDGLGPLEHFVSGLYAKPREIALAPAAAGRVQLVTTIEIGDGSGELVTVHARADVTAVLSREPGHLFVTIAVPPDQASKLRLDLGPRAVDQLGDALAQRLPAIARDHVPKPVIDRVAAAVVEQLVEHGYSLGQGLLLRSIEDRMRVRIELPDLPADRVVMTSIGDTALELAVYTTLPVRDGLPAEVAPMGDGVDIRIAGSAAAELVNWGVAHGELPPRYSRELKPQQGGEWIPYIDWRPGDARPLVVHMFKVDGGCGHFISALQPHIELVGDKLDSWTTNQTLERADTYFALEVLARLSELFASGTSGRKHTASTLKIAIAGREVSARLTYAQVTARELHVAVALALGPNAPAPGLIRPASASIAGCRVARSRT